MTDPVARLVLLVATIGVASVLVTAVHRRVGRASRAHLPAGLVVVTGPDCSWCDRLVSALNQRGKGSHLIIDHAEATERGLKVRSVPTALVVTRNGAVVMRRSGPGALRDVDALLARAGSRREGAVRP